MNRRRGRRTNERSYHRSAAVRLAPAFTPTVVDEGVLDRRNGWLPCRDRSFLDGRRNPGSCRIRNTQELRTVRVRDGLLDKVSDGVIGEVTLEFIPGSDQAA